jgi:N-acetylneuraminic acid mutarotase
VNSTTYIYCIGGQDINGGPRNEIFSSPSLSSSSGNNITGWISGSSQYPQNINGQSCVAYSTYVYCVGGTYDDGGDDIASSYYAPLSGGVVGTWSSTTAFPIPVDTQSCVASSGYVYCVGGNNETDGTDADSVLSTSVYFAPLSSSGIGSWSQTTAYPQGVYLPACFSTSDYIYCIGGADSNDNAVSTDYYASLSSSGVGAWTQTTAYPIAASGQACAISSGYIYCVGGEETESSYTNAVRYAPVTSGGIGAWEGAPNYPLSTGTTCVLASGTLYCIGGFDGSSAGESSTVYYASLSSLSSATPTG